jgi:hypothetical protein
MAQMPANGLTKALPAQKHATFLRQLNLVNISKRLGENNNNGGGDTKGPESDHGLRTADEEEGEEDGGRLAYFGVF